MAKWYEGREPSSWDDRGDYSRPFLAFCMETHDYPSRLYAIEVVKSATQPARYCKHCERREKKVANAK